MSTDARTWVARGTTVIGTAPDRPDITWDSTPTAKSTTTKELKRVAQLLADALNADGEPRPLSDNEQAVLDAVLAHQAQHDWPAPIGKIVEQTGLVRPTVSAILDRLVDRGLGTRPPRNSPDRPIQHRPFVAHRRPNPEETR